MTVVVDDTQEVLSICQSLHCFHAWPHSSHKGCEVSTTITSSSQKKEHGVCNKFIKLPPNCTAGKVQGLGLNSILVNFNDPRCYIASKVVAFLGGIHTP